LTDPRAEALALLARFQVADVTVGEALNEIADITLAALPAAAVAGMTMLGEDGQPTTAVYTDEESPEIDAAQYREGKGPCLDAWLNRRVCRISDTREAAERFPAFASACRDHGVYSTLSLPMVSADIAIGALNLYAHSTDAFSDDDEDLGLELAGAASSVLSNVSAYWTAFDLSQQLSEAMLTRAVIEQAKGMLMASSPNMGADDAFQMLRKASQREHVKLNEIARRIVERRQPPAEDEGAAG
jgi:transcriptional regulator with GAF, ATPase, and Fis domain